MLEILPPPTVGMHPAVPPRRPPSPPAQGRDQVSAVCAGRRDHPPRTDACVVPERTGRRDARDRDGQARPAVPTHRTGAGNPAHLRPAILGR